MAKTQAPQQYQRHHHAGALHRHIEPGEQAVTQRRRECQATRPRQPGPAQRPDSETRQPGNQQIHHCGEQTDVLAGDHQQMHGAGVLQYLPILATEPRAITEHQRCQRALASLRIHRQQALANAVAPCMPGLSQALAILDRAGCADPLREQPGLVVEGVRVEQATRALQLHRQAPAFAAVDRRPGVPGQAQQRWQFFVA